MLNTDFSDLYVTGLLTTNSVSILVMTKQNVFYLPLKIKVKKAEPLNINFQGIEIEQHSKVNYLGCILDEKA